MSDKIDFVVTWVDGSDKEWLNEKNKYSVEAIDVDASIERYRDWDILRYWFRAVEKYASWVNKIYFVTNGQKPSWLNEKNPKLELVKHSDYIEDKYLPTFNSCVIESKLMNIKGLSEKFVYFNDDMYINSKVSPSDFYKDDLPLDNLVFNPINASEDTSTAINYNCTKLINRNFNVNKIKKEQKKKLFSLKNGKYILKNLSLYSYPYNVGFRFHHLPTSFLKSTFNEVWEKEGKYLEEMCSNRFRTDRDVSQWLFQFWQLAENKYNLRDVKNGQYFDLNRGFDLAIKEVQTGKHKLICLNDSGKIENFDEKKTKLIETFEKRYTQKSSFEI